MTDLPDVKLRALVNFPVSVTGRTAIAIQKTSGRYFIDLDVSNLVQNPNISSDQVDESWMLIWNETTDAYELVPYALAATAGVASIDGKTGALDISYPLQFSGDTLDFDLGGVLTIATYDAAAAGAVIPNSVTAVRLLGRSSPFDGGAVDAVYTGSEPAHEGKWQAPDGRWFKFKCPDLVRAEMFGAPPGGVALDGADQAAVLQDMIEFANIEHPSEILIPQGQWPVDSAMPTIIYICKVRGEQSGPQPAVIWKRYVEADATKGVFSWAACGPNVEGLQFGADTATASGGSFISAILTNAAPNAGVMRLTNFYFSGGSGVNHNVTIDGSVNNSETPGYRSIFFTSGHSFGTAVHPWNFKSVRHVFASNVYSDINGVGAASSAMKIDGTVGVPSDDIHWMGFINGDVSLSHLFGNPNQFHAPINGNVAVDNSSLINFYGNISGDVTWGGNNSDIQVYGLVFGSITGTSPTGTSGRVSSAGGQSF